MRSKRDSAGAMGVRVKTWIGACCMLAAACSALAAAEDGRRHRSSALLDREFVEGKALFEKSWQPGQRSPAGGDGLGPLYNEVSCVACHNQGGTGGGGESDRDVLMLTAVAGSDASLPGRKVYQGEIEDLHPGFRNRASIVLHRHATDAKMQKRLDEIETIEVVQTREEIKLLRKGRRNTPALFGAGLIDAVLDKVLRDAEKRSYPSFPEIKGRASTLPDGRLGRFGWKGQIASLDNFVRAACSNELGLEVPGHHQVSLASAKDFNPSALKLDMSEEQCALITEFLARLAPPLQRFADGRVAPPWGYMVFESIGCATCHAPKLGDVMGIYSDLLLHDMGASSSDSATYYGTPVAPPPSSRDVADAKEPVRRSGMADATEWRTPPLWGVANSAPYLHDGRAPTLDDAIRRHGGEAAKTADRYIKLASSDRRAVVTFLSSLKVSAEPKKPAGPLRKRRSRGSSTPISLSLAGKP